MNEEFKDGSENILLELKVLKEKSSIFMLDESKIITSFEKRLLLIRFLDTKYKKASLIFSGSIDGWLIDDFHNNCDNQGPTLIIIKEIKGRVFGGFTTQCWSINDYK